MKKTTLVAFVLVFLSLIACKKKSNPAEDTPVSTTTSENYGSLADFYSKNGVPLQTFTFNAGDSKSYVSTQGTTINIPANTFSPSTAIITVEFKDIYKKSDMLLSNMPTLYYTKLPLVSAGEFFIKAKNGNTAIDKVGGKNIEVVQPAMNKTIDTSMKALVGLNDSGAVNWFPSTAVGLFYRASSYVYNLYSFSSPVSAGTWCNSDNPYYFSAFNQSQLVLHPNQSGYIIDAFLVFKNINSMVHVYPDYTGNYIYKYAPIGLECTVVILGLKDNKLYSSFKPITISANQTVNFDLSETATDKFKADLKALD